MTSTFADLGVPNDLVTVLTKAGITDAFPIQSATLGDSLAGRDLCGKAPTGSGKTLAFAIPVAARVGKAKPGRPRALILTPTRELAAQIRETLQPLAKTRGRSVETFYGGTSLSKDLQRLKRGVDVVVATPGRLTDLIKRRACNLADVDIVVLDEADRMADMGFLPVVRQILDDTKRDRQTLLFSATLDGDIDVLVRNYQSNPARHEMDEPVVAQGEIRHLFWPADRLDRRYVTAEIVKRIGPAIVFTRTKRGADRLARQLTQAGISTAAIHGDRSQNQRERALSQFTTGKINVLVATDVAARGIHVDNVGIVVHYDIAGTDKDYVHRSGRTGRAGASGVVVTLVTDQDADALRDIQKSLDMPRGTHEVDFTHLTSDRVPELTRTVPSGPKGTRPSGNRPPRQGQGNGQGGRGQNNRGQGGRGQGQGNRGQSQNDRGGSSSTDSGRTGQKAGGGNQRRKAAQPAGSGGGNAGGQRSGAPKGGARSRNRRASA